MIYGISHVTLFVRNQDEAKDNYVNKLGFTVGTDMPMGEGMRWLTVKPPEQQNVEFVLMEPGAPMFTPEQVDAVNSLLATDSLGAGVLGTSDCRGTYETLKAKGVQFKGEPNEEFYGVAVIMLDGCGNWFSLCEPKPH